MQFAQGVYLLSPAFVRDYPHSVYPELLLKQGRPYTCLLIACRDYIACIPFRSSIQHRNAYLFTSSRRSQRTKSGLDYTKMVLLKNLDYIDFTVHPVVDQDEYREMMQQIRRITREAEVYIGGYVEHRKGTVCLHPREFQRKYQYSTLKYFHDILGIE